MKKKTVVIGASPNRARYSYAACVSLHENGHEFVPVGIKKGQILGKDILNMKERPHVSDIDTVTLYLNPAHQEEWYEYFIGLAPRRIIFNPGTENHELRKLAQKEGIETEYSCTLVLLSTGQY